MMYKRDNYETKLISDLAEIETLFNVEKISHNGVYLWPMLKIKVYFEIWTKLNTTSNTSSPISIYNKIFLFLIKGARVLLLDFKNNILPRKSNVLVFADPFNRRVDVNEKRYEIYSDPIITNLNKLNLKTFVVERNSINNYPTPRFTKSFPQFLLQIPFTLLNLRRDCNLSSEAWAVLNQIEIHLKNKSYNFDSLNSKKVSSFLRIFSVHFDMYNFLYKYTRIKYVVLSEWYSIVSIAAITAAKKLDIATVELQHGVQSEAHIAYGNWNAQINKVLITPFPDYFWVWSESDAKNIEKVFSKYNSKAFVGGNKYIESVLTSEISSGGENQLKALIGNSLKKIALITLQPAYELNVQIQEFIKRFKDDYFFLIRLHPVMSHDTEKYENQLKNLTPNTIDFDLKLSTELPLLTLLKFTDLHATFNSSVVIEAELMNVPSYVFDSDIAQIYFDQQIKNGSCKIFSDLTFPNSDNFDKTTFCKTQKASEPIASLFKKYRDLKN